jgi:hypothetical protein
MNLGSSSTSWELRRVPLADTTAEFEVNSRIQISDGLYSGKVYRVKSYDNELLQSNGVVLNTGTPLAVTAGLKRAADEITVNFATSEKLVGSFSPGSDALNNWDILGSTAGLVLDGVAVTNGQRVLVRQGLVNDPINDPINGYALDWSNELSWPTNGVYEKLETQAPGGQTVWALRRIFPASSADSPATVVVTDGLYRTAVTGETFTVAYDGLGIEDLDIELEVLETEIGSYDPNGTTTFVVSTSGGTNSDPGSLGKMLSLVQANNAKDLTGELLDQAVRFGNVLGDVNGPTGTIALRQELPRISKPFTLDGNNSNRYELSEADQNQDIFIDGSRITSTRGGSFVSNDIVVNGLEYVAGSGTTLDVQVNGVSQTIPEEATRGVLRTVKLIGFEQGGAVVIDGASNLLVRDLEIGEDADGAPQPSKYGIQVTGLSGENGPVTLLDNEIYNSILQTGDRTNPLIGAGIQINDKQDLGVVEKPQGVQIIGGAIGKEGGRNTSGIVVESTNDDTTRAHSIGVNPIPDGFEVPLQTIANKSTLLIPETIWNVIGEDLFLGQTVSGQGIESASEIVHIDPTLKLPLIPPDPNQPLVSYVEVVLSERMTTSTDIDVPALITFGAPNRTTVTENYFGVDLESGNARITNTTISNNAVSGIRVGTTIPDAIWAKIGAGIALDASGNPDPTVRSSASNAIHGNGRYGIQFASGITSSTSSNGVPTVIEIKGNYVGTNTSSTVGLQNGRADYYWDSVNSNDPTPLGDPVFDNLKVALDPVSEPAVDDQGNLSAELGGTDFSSGSGGSGSSGNGGIVHIPPRR